MHLTHSGGFGELLPTNQLVVMARLCDVSVRRWHVAGVFLTLLLSGQ